ncbi:MAG: efflux RND transporter periplasmic adaptor subunit [Pseudomonadota bacterium]
MSKKKMIIPVVVLILAGAGLFYYFEYYVPEKENGLIKASGHIELTEVDLSYRLAGHVDRLVVEEGDVVEKGGLLAELRPETFRFRRDQAAAAVRELESRVDSLKLAIEIKSEVADAEVSRAEASVQAAQARYQSLKTGSREEEIRAAAASRDRTLVEWKNRDKDLKRIRGLYEANVVPPTQFDAALAAADSAKAALAALEEQYRLVKAGPRREAVDEGRANLDVTDSALEGAKAARREVAKLQLDLKALEAQLDQARAALALAEDDLARTRIYAPFTGFVTVKDVEENEYVQPGAPVLTMADLDHVKVKTYIPETKLGRVRLGQEAEVHSDSFPGKKYIGRITFISPEAEFTPKNVQTEEERIKLVYRVKVELDNPNQELKGGMPVDVLVR